MVSIFMFFTSINTIALGVNSKSRYFLFSSKNKAPCCFYQQELERYSLPANMAKNEIVTSHSGYLPIVPMLELYRESSDNVHFVMSDFFNSLVNPSDNAILL